MMKTLMILAHSNIQNSLANKIIADQISQLADTEVRNLGQLYPDFQIDIAAEQQALLQADLIIFQYPFHWYSVPGILKEWMDRVFLFGFAYGPDSQLRGKNLLVSTTIGGPLNSYAAGGHNHFTTQELLRPLEQSANFTGMVFLPPLISHDMVYKTGGDNSREDITQRAHEHAEQLCRLIQQKSASFMQQGAPSAA